MLPSDELYRMILHVDGMSFHVGVTRRAICDCDLLHVDVMSEHVGVMWRTIFAARDIRLRSSVAIFSSDAACSDAVSFGLSFGRLCTWT